MLHLRQLHQDIPFAIDLGACANVQVSILCEYVQVRSNVVVPVRLCVCVRQWGSVSPGERVAPGPNRSATQQSLGNNSRK